MVGATFSQSHYDLYKETGNKNLFEEVLDQLVMDEHLDLPQEVKDYIMSEESRSDKRLYILANLLKDHSAEIVESFNKVREFSTRTENLKNALLTLNKYIEVGQQEVKKYGEVFTPLSLVKEMVATLPEEVWSNPNLKWLDPCNGMGNFPLIVIYKLMKGLESWEPDAEKRYKHIIENMIYVCELQPRNAFMYLSLVDPKDDLDVNLYCGSFLDEGFDNHMKQVWNIEKFDIVLGNPPYNQTIDLKFLTKSYNISEQILFVHPSTWLIDEKNKQSKFIKAKNIVGESLKSIRLFNGNPIFKIGLFVPCSITYIDKSYNGSIKLYDDINNVEVDYDSVEKINKYNTEEYESLKYKIISNNNLWSNKYSEGGFFINISQIRGNVNMNKSENSFMIKDDFYTIVTKDEYVTDKKTKHLYYGFHTKGEADNFLKYLKSKFARFSLSIYKINSQLCRGELSSIPWLDFTQEWTDEKLKEYFNITDKEWEFIESVIPDYY